MRKSACLLIAFAFFACRPSPLDQSPSLTPPIGSPDSAASTWQPSQGFVVHEWGTLTSVLGSDGVLLPGLHHEEEDLPPFVADRMKQAQTTPWVVQKMETPVTYFYSAQPLAATASVRFPDGIFSQWYPFAQDIAPPLLLTGAPQASDPWLDAGALQSQIPPECQGKFDRFHDGLLDWGTVDVLARDDSPALPGPVDGTNWGFARNVASNAIAATLPDGSRQNERFLFYRGLGNFTLPLAATVGNDGPTLANGATQTLGGLFLMVVTADGAGFASLGDLAPGSSVSAPLPAPAMAHDAFVAALKAAVRDRLVRDGLFTDEAQAMVDTWAKSWFLTPGVRAFYLLPQAITDAVIPLSISPAPSETRRTMVIRVELLTPSYEAQLSSWLSSLASGDASARQEFLGLGRFAEPHLQRAIALAKTDAERAAGQSLLDEIRANRRWSPTTAE